MRRVPQVPHTVPHSSFFGSGIFNGSPTNCPTSLSGFFFQIYKFDRSSSLTLASCLLAPGCFLGDDDDVKREEKRKMMEHGLRNSSVQDFAKIGSNPNDSKKESKRRKTDRTNNNNKKQRKRNRKRRSMKKRREEHDR